VSLRTPRAAHIEPRALCSLELLGDSRTPRAAQFEPRALCSLELLGVPLDTARRLANNRLTCFLPPWYLSISAVEVGPFCFSKVAHNGSNSGFFP